MADAVVAGKLEIPVESDTTGFAAQLKTKIEQIAREVKARIEVEVDDRNLREELEAKVKKATTGVKAKVEVEVDVDGKSRIVEDVKRQSLLARLFAKKNPIQVAVKTGDSGFGKTVAKWRNDFQKGLKRAPLEIPILLPKFGRGAAMPLLFLSIASVIQPAIAAIVGSLGGLVAMLGNVAVAAKTLAVAPGGIIALVGGIVAGTLAIKALSGEMKDLPPALRSIREEFAALEKPWKAIQADTAIAFWSQLKGQIKPTGEVLLPLLNKAMERFGTVLGDTASDTAAWLRSPLFSGQFERTTAVAAKTLDSFGGILNGAAKGFFNIADAATIVVGGKGGQSLMERFNGFLDGIGDWAGQIAAPGDAATIFAVQLAYAADKAGQLWQMTKDLASGIAGVFRAGRESGDRLLADLGDSLSGWAEWVASSDGQKAIKDWFDAVEPIAREAGKLLADIGKGILDLAADPNVATMLNSIRNDLLPTLLSFLDNLGQTLGPEVIQFVTDLIDVFSELSEAGGPLSVGLGYANEALGTLASTLAANPDMAKVLGTILGALLAFRLLNFIGQITGIVPLLGGIANVLKGGGLLKLAAVGAVIAVFTGELKGLPGPVQAAVAALGTFFALRTFVGPVSSALTNLGGVMRTLPGTFAAAGTAWQTAGRQFKGGGFSGAAASIGTTAKAGLRGALSGLGALVGGALGGPVGIGLAAVSVGVGLWAQKHAESAAAAQAYRDYVDQIVASLDAETGALTAATEAAVAKTLIDNGAADSAKKYSVNLADLTQAGLGNANAQGRVRTALIASATEASKGAENYAALEKGLANAGISTRAFAAAQIAGGSTLANLKLRLAEANGGIGNMEPALEAAAASSEYLTKGQRELAAQVGASSGAVEAARAKQAQLAEMLDKVGKEVTKVTDALQGLPPGKTVTVKSLTSEAESKLRALGYKVETLPDGSVRITATAETARAESALNSTARNRTSTVTQFVRTVGGRVNGVNAGLMADGGILNFANGGLVQQLARSVKSFADGAEKHVAQIAPAGAWRVWAEPETGGEAYIPLAPSKRTRSLEILSEVAKRFGLALAPAVSDIAAAARPLGGSYGFFANGGLTGPTLPAKPLKQVTTGPRTQFLPGSVLIQNPAPEPASRSLADFARRIETSGLFEGDDD